jgi:hypothetical protein
MPSAQPSADYSIRGGHPEARSRLQGPLIDSGSLESFAYLDSTPVIGREYTGLNVVDLLNHPDGDRLIKDLAITGISVW